MDSGISTKKVVQLMVDFIMENSQLLGSYRLNKAQNPVMQAIASNPKSSRIFNAEVLPAPDNPVTIKILLDITSYLIKLDFNFCNCRRTFTENFNFRKFYT